MEELEDFIMTMIALGSVGFNKGYRQCVSKAIDKRSKVNKKTMLVFDPNKLVIEVDKKHKSEMSKK